ncbi:MAG: hypothetical protein ACYSXF_10060 [Planctomycetota bacterium]
MMRTRWIAAVILACVATTTHAETPGVSLRDRLDAISSRLESLDARVEGVLDRIERRLAIVEVELVTLGAVAAPPVPELFVDAPEPPVEQEPIPADLPSLVASPGLFADLAEHAAGVLPAASPAIVDVMPVMFRRESAQLIAAAGVVALVTVLLLVGVGRASAYEGSIRLDHPDYRTVRFAPADSAEAALDPRRCSVDDERFPELAAGA